MNARDIAIRTILGEAANESPIGQAGVAHVLMNRAADPRWPSSIEDVALQDKQFSAWNSGAGGNDLVNKYGPGDSPYDRVGMIYDQVAAGKIEDPTGGATHYFSPAGMQALVSEGSQANVLPRWLQEENQRRGGGPTQIGGHLFTGRAEGSPELTFGLPPVDTNTVGTSAPFEFPAMEDAEKPTLMSALSGIGKILAEQQAPEAPPLLRPQVQPYQPVRRDTTAIYRELFQSLGG